MIQLDLATNNMSDDEAYEVAPFQFTVDRIRELVAFAEKDPKQQVVVPCDTMHKIYMAYLGVLDVYQQQTAAGLLVNGERFICSTELQRAIAPLIQESHRLQAEQDLSREVALMEEAALQSEGAANESAKVQRRIQNSLLKLH
jgi:hypothetical protein